jgi:large subunit ribosomal protein L22e
LIDHIKIEGKTGQLGEDVKIERQDEGKLSVTSTKPMNKRYIKYLTKKVSSVLLCCVKGPRLTFSAV